MEFGRVLRFFFVSSDIPISLPCAASKVYSQFWMSLSLDAFKPLNFQTSTRLWPNSQFSMFLETNAKRVAKIPQRVFWDTHTHTFGMCSSSWKKSWGFCCVLQTSAIVFLSLFLQSLCPSFVWALEKDFLRKRRSNRMCTFVYVTNTKKEASGLLVGTQTRLPSVFSEMEFSSCVGQRYVTCILATNMFLYSESFCRTKKGFPALTLLNVVGVVPRHERKPALFYASIKQFIFETRVSSKVPIWCKRSHFSRVALRLTKTQEENHTQEEPYTHDAIPFTCTHAQCTSTQHKWTNRKPNRRPSQPTNVQTNLDHITRVTALLKSTFGSTLYRKYFNKWYQFSNCSFLFIFPGGKSSGGQTAVIQRTASVLTKTLIGK